MRLRIISLLAISLLLSLSFVQFSQGATSTPATFSTSGTIFYSQTPNSTKVYVDGVTIRDSSGNPLQIKGFNVELHDVAITGGYPEFVQWLKNNGFNSVRALVWWHDFEPTEGDYNSNYFEYLDDLIINCEQQNIYVNICFHQWQYSPFFNYGTGKGAGFPDWLISNGGYSDSATGAKQFTSDFYQKQGYGITARQKFLEFWQYLANRYKDYNNVWAYELMNEPTIISGFSWDDAALTGIMDFYEDVTSPLRAIDPNTILIYHYISGAVASQGRLDYERPVPYSNIVWTRSWYDQAYGSYDPSEYPYVLTRLTNLKNAFNDQLGTPFTISEMGISITDYNTNPSGAEQWIRDTFDVIRNIGVNNGYEAWSWYLYHKGNPSIGKHGYTIPRDASGDNTWMVSVFQEYF